MKGYLRLILAVAISTALLTGAGTASGAAKIKGTVTGEYMGTKAEVEVELTNPANLEVTKKDYYRYLTEMEIGGGLTMPMDSEDDYDVMIEKATTEAIEHNEQEVQRRKANRLDKQVLDDAKKRADALAKEAFETQWILLNEKMELPKDTTGSTKTYMDYKTVTNVASKQYALLNSKKAYTKDGFRMYDDCYCIALGSFYSREIGTKFEIELSTGVKLNCILGDQKSDRHTDINHQYAVKNGDVVEFIIDGLMLPGGDVSMIPGFEGQVVGIKKICEPNYYNFEY